MIYSLRQIFGAGSLLEGEGVTRMDKYDWLMLTLSLIQTVIALLTFLN